MASGVAEHHATPWSASGIIYWIPGWEISAKAAAPYRSAPMIGSHRPGRAVLPLLVFLEGTSEPRRLASECKEAGLIALHEPFIIAKHNLKHQAEVGGGQVST